MGMSASQVRFLSLQSRKNDITRQLSTLSNKKMSLSRDMNKVSKNYTNALNQRLLKWSNDSGSTYNTLTYNLMMRPNDYNFTKPYILTKPSTGEVVLNSDALNLEQYDLTPTEASLNYKKLATYISSFIGVDDNGKVLYTTDGQPLNFDADSNSTNATNIVTDADGKIHGGKLKDGAQFITNDKDFSFKSNVRYDIYLKMGLITDEDYHKQVQCLTALYGTQEAKDTGIYPVGSAWGDYYLAQANLEAYDDYLSNSHEISNSSYADDSRKTSKTYNDPQDPAESTPYSYKTDVYNGTAYNGDSGISYTEQKGNKKGSEAHVDFSAIVITTGDGQYVYAKDGSTEINSILNQDQNSIYDNNWSYFRDTNDTIYKNDYTSTSTDTKMKTQITQSGMDYSYTTNDILENAITNIKGTEGFSMTGADKDRPADSIQNCIANIESGGSKVTAQVQVNAYAGYGNTQNSAKTLIQNLLEQYSNIIVNNTIVDFTTKDWTDAIKKAKDATYNLLQNNTKGSGVDSDHSKDKVIGEATDNAEDCAIGMARKKWNPFHRAYSVSVVNTKIVYNTFMTLVNAFHNNSNGVESLAEAKKNSQQIEPPTQTFVDDDGSTIDDCAIPLSGMRARTFGGKDYVENSATAKNSKGQYVTQISRSELTTNSAEAEDTREALYKNGSIYKTTNDTAHPSVPYYMKKNKVEELTYYSGASGSIGSAQSMYINETYGTKNVYGTLDTGDALYYFIDKNALQDYINNGNISTNTNKVARIGTLPDIDTLPVTIQDDGRDKIYLDKSFRASYEDIKVDGYVNEDSKYRDTLVKKVKDAKERIDDLENQMENIYSGSNKKLMDFYDALFERIAENGWTIDENTSSDNRGNKASTYLNNKLQNNDYFIAVPEAKIDSNGYNYTSKMAQSVTKIYTVNDENEQNSALSKYEADKNLISSKENKIDLIMQKLETEQEAINTEMESVKKIENENIEKTFKIFA